MWNLFYRHPRLLVLTVLLLIVSGLAAYSLLPRKEDPSLTQRFVLVTTRFPGASAERVESLVTEKIEDKLRTLDGIEEINSTSRAGISVVSVQLQDTIVDGNAVWSRLRDRLRDVTPLLPEGAREPEFDETRTDPDAYTLIAALTWEQASPVSYAILRRLSEQLKDELHALPGTKHTALFGDPTEEIRIEIDPAYATSLGLTSADIAQAVARTDAKVAAGQLRGAHNDLLIEVEGKLDSLQRVRRTPIRYGRHGQVVQLGDIATISKTISDPPSELALIDGKPGIAVAARMETSRRIDQWALHARQTLETFRQQLPPGLGLHLIFDQSRYVASRLHSLQKNLLFGALLVMLVTLVMMGWQSALLVGLALPLSSLAVLAGLHVLGVPMDQMSVTGLIIALGMLIDNAIIVVDDVRARLRQGRAPANAVVESVRHLIIPLFASTITTVLAFMPLLLMPGSTGEFVSPIGLSVILALLSSLFIALTIVAALTGRLQHRRDDGARWWHMGITYPGLTEMYRRTLRQLLARPVWGLLLALTLPITGFVLRSQLQEQFFPPSDRDQFQIQVQLPAHTSLQQTHAFVRKARTVLRRHADVAHVHWFVGGNAPKFYYNMRGSQDDAAYFAQALVQLRSAKAVTQTVRTLQDEMDQHFPAAQVLVKQLEQGPPFNAPIEMHLYGPDLDRLRDIGERMRAELARIPDVIHTRTTLSDGLPALWLHLDAEAIRLAGLDNVGIAAQLQQTLEGVSGGSLVEATEELPVRVRLVQARRGTLADIASLDLLPLAEAPRASMGGKGIPIQAVGQLDLVPTQSTIPHRDGERANTVQGFITAGVLPAAVLERFKARLQAMPLVLPPGYRYDFGGESGERNEAVRNLFASVGVLVVLMAATLVLSFNSFRLAGIIAVVAILSAGMALGALWVFGYPFGFTAIVGTLGLIGVSVNDATVVLAALRQQPLARDGHVEAVQDVIVHSTRHVLTTSVTTVAGFTPLLLSGGGFWPPLATALAGGVVGATLLALYFVPSAYILLVKRRAAPHPQSAATTVLDERMMSFSSGTH